MRKCTNIFTIYEEIVSHIWLCTRSLWISLYLGKILFSFLSVHGTISSCCQFPGFILVCGVGISRDKPILLGKEFYASFPSSRLGIPGPLMLMGISRDHATQWIFRHHYSCRRGFYEQSSFDRWKIFGTIYFWLDYRYLSPSSSTDKCYCYPLSLLENRDYRN